MSGYAFNTYHLHVRPGERWLIPWAEYASLPAGKACPYRFGISGLFPNRNITEEGVAFQSHVDGAKIFMSPEVSMQIQSRLASTIAMAFDECPSSVAEYSYIKKSCERTTRWLYRCVDEMKKLNALDDTLNKDQLLFGINQGGVYKDLRIEHIKHINELDLPGYAIADWRW